MYEKTNRRRVRRCLTIMVILAFSLRGIAQDNPNILFLAVDDLKPTIGAFGDPIALTPNIDALASRGMAFTNTHCQQAVCAPSRASLMTSRYPDQTGVWDLETLIRDVNPDILTLPQYLISKGYSTMGTGKIYDSRSVDSKADAASWSVPFRRSWDKKYYYNEIKPVGYFYASPEARDTMARLTAEAQALGVNVMEHIKAHYFPSWEKTDVPIDAYPDGAILNVGTELMQEAANSNKPFFLAIGFNRPHLPFNAPTQFWDLYQRDDIPLATFREKASGTTSLAYHTWGELKSYTDIPDVDALEEEQQRTLIHAYYAATSYIDHLIGLTIEKLDELGLSENTIIVLWGDHGWHLGDHGIWCKHSNFEQATRAPLIIYDPRHPHNEHLCSSPVEFTDIAPTLLDLAGISLPVDFEGKSLLPLLDDSTASVRQASLSQYPRNGHMGYSLRSSRYRYNQWIKSDGSVVAEELYDYQEDPLETMNLVGDESYREVVLEMDSIMKERIVIPSTQVRLGITLLGEESPGELSPVAGAFLHFGGKIFESDAKGQVFLTHSEGLHRLQVAHELFMDHQEDILLEINLEKEIILDRKLPVYQLDLEFSDAHNGRSLKNVVVSLEARDEEAMQNPVSIATDSYGQATVNLDSGKYHFLAEKSYYYSLEDDFILSGSTSLVYELSASHANIKLRLKENSSPVYGASVSLAGQRIESNSVGVALFEWLPTEQNYDYRIEKESYQTKEGSLVLLTDTTIELQISKNTSGMSSPGDELFIKPNPAGDFILLPIAAQGKDITVEIFDMQGRIVQKETLKQGASELNVQSLSSGLYSLTITIGNERKQMKLIKK